MTAPIDPTAPAGPEPHVAAMHDGVPEHAPDDPLHNPEVAHEHSDINIRAILMFLVIIGAVTALSAAAMGGLFKLLETMALKNDPVTSPVAAPAGQEPPEPRLLKDEPRALAKQRAEERKVLETYGWVDQTSGVARVPIEEAKKLLLQRGLPTRAGEPVDPRLGTGAAAMSDASSGRRAVVPQKATAVTSEKTETSGKTETSEKPETSGKTGKTGTSEKKPEKKQ